MQKYLSTNETSLELEYYDKLHAEKYRDTNQTRDEHNRHMAYKFSTNKEHEEKLYDIFSNERFLPAGRMQAALGATRSVKSMLTWLPSIECLPKPQTLAGEHCWFSQGLELSAFLAKPRDSNGTTSHGRQNEYPL